MSRQDVGDCLLSIGLRLRLDSPRRSFCKDAITSGTSTHISKLSLIGYKVLPGSWHLFRSDGGGWPIASDVGTHKSCPRRLLVCGRTSLRSSFAALDRMMCGGKANCDRQALRMVDELISTAIQKTSANRSGIPTFTHSISLGYPQKSPQWRKFLGFKEGAALVSY